MARKFMIVGHEKIGKGSVPKESRAGISRQRLGIGERTTFAARLIMGRRRGTIRAVLGGQWGRGFTRRSKLWRQQRRELQRQVRTGNGLSWSGGRNMRGKGGPTSCGLPPSERFIWWSWRITTG